MLWVCIAPSAARGPAPGSGLLGANIIQINDHYNQTSIAGQKNLQGRSTGINLPYLIKDLLPLAFHPPRAKEVSGCRCFVLGDKKSWSLLESLSRCNKL